MGSSRSTVKWYALQHLLEEAVSDVLLLLDSNASVSSGEQESSGGGIFEAIAACGYGSLALPPGESSFTSFLIQELRFLSIGPPFSAERLYRKLTVRIAQSGGRIPPTPMYWRLGGSKFRQSVLLQPYRKSGDMTPTRETVPGQDTLAEPTSSRLLISVKLKEDQGLNLQDWKAWLTNVPDDIKAMHIEVERKIAAESVFRSD